MTRANVISLLLVVILVSGCLSKNDRSDFTPVQVIQTALGTKDRLTPLDPIYFKKVGDSKLDNLIVLNPRVLLQKIIGFGCALTEASSFVFSTMNEDLKQRTLDLYWSPRGLNYTIGRMPMNSCDFALGTYSCDDTYYDYDLKEFSIKRDGLFKLPLAQRVVNTTKLHHGQPLKLFLSPWSPPAWMKTNKNMEGSGKPIGLINNTLTLNSWALYYSKYITEYGKQGVPFWGLTVQNEPAPYEACVYTAEYERDFIKNHLGPRIVKDHPNVKILIYDHNRDHIQLWAKTIYSDPEASKYVAGTAFHWYVDGQYEHLQMTHDIAPEKILLASEATQGPNVVIGDWGRGESYGYDIINDLQNYAQGWTDWNCILNPTGGPTHMENWCDAAIIFYNSSQTVYLQPMYYYMGHFSKYLVQDSARVLLDQSEAKDLLITAFVTPQNKMVVVVMNNGDLPRTFNLKDLSMGTDYYLPVTLLAHSIRTLIYDLSSQLYQ